MEVGQGHVFPLFMCVSCRFALSLSFLSVSVGRPGGGRGSYRGPSADCGRSRRTVNRKGLYIISS